MVAGLFLFIPILFWKYTNYFDFYFMTLFLHSVWYCVPSWSCTYFIVYCWYQMSCYVLFECRSTKMSVYIIYFSLLWPLWNASNVTLLYYVTYVTCHDLCDLTGTVTYVLTMDQLCKLIHEISVFNTSPALLLIILRNVIIMWIQHAFLNRFKLLSTFVCYFPVNFQYLARIFFLI